MKRERVAIVGAATSGLIAARSLGRHGVETTVYDQKTRLGFPVRASGILSISGLAGLKIGYRSGITNTLRGARIHAGKREMTIRAGGDIAYVLDRIKLNEICRDEAEAAGAKVVTGKKIDGQALDQLHADNIMVGADGAVSTVARHFAMGGMGKHVLTYKAEYDVGGLDDMVDLFFGRDISPNFFAWFCPNTKDVLEVGIGVDPAYGNAKRAFDNFIKREEVKSVIGNAKMLDGAACIIPMSLRRKIVDNAGEVLLVGDAAGQVKPSTGGGIIFGGNAAMLAADAINNHIRDGDSLEAYDKAFRKGFLMDLKMHSIVNKLYSGLGTRGVESALGVMGMLGMDSFLGKHGDMDRPTLILKRLFLRERG